MIDTIFLNHLKIIYEKLLYSVLSVLATNPSFDQWTSYYNALNTPVKTLKITNLTKYIVCQSLTDLR